MGQCNSAGDCDKVCKSVRSHGQGVCNKNQCFCIYECDDPRETCDEDFLGVCDAAGSPSCDKKCKAKHKDGEGSCFYTLCFCDYNCESPSLGKPNKFHGI